MRILGMEVGSFRATRMLACGAAILAGPLEWTVLGQTLVQDGQSQGFNGSSVAPSVVDLDPLIVSVSRYEEDLLKAPASVTIINSGDLDREGSPSVVAMFRNVPGVDFQQAGINHYLIAVRGFNNAFASSTYVMVDHRDAYNPALAMVYYSRLPIDALDIDRIEIVRGPGSAVYGPGVEQGVIHFITKDPFTEPGSSLAVGLGEQSMRMVSFRQAGVINEKLAYKITGTLEQAEDWKLDPNNPADSVILKAIFREKKDLDGNVARIVEGRDYETYTWNLSGEVHYRFNEETRLMAHVDYGQLKGILNASLGEIQMDGPGLMTAQVQLQSGPFWIQAYGVKEFVDGDNFFYRADSLMYGHSTEFNLQAQYKLDWSEDEEPVLIGADYKLTTPRTSGTITGRFEDEDTFNSVGGYIEGVKALTAHLDFKASGRVDHIEATKETVFSPRAALVYQAAREHTFRLTYNRALSRPIATDFYGDLQVGQIITPDGLAVARMRFLGGSTGFTFPDPLQTSSFVGPGRDTGIGMATARAYAALSQPVTAALQEDPTSLGNFLLSKLSAIDGFSAGIMTFSPGSGEDVQNLPESEPTRSPITDTFEIGYKGILRERILVGIDLYYAKKKDYLFVKVVTPFVEIPAATLASDLDQAVRTAFTDMELTPYGIDVNALAATYAQYSAALAGVPIGIVEPDQNYNPDTLPEMVLAQLNAGTLDYYGIDLSVEAFFNDQWSAFANYSWVSDNSFDETDLGLPGTGFVVSMNSPQHKIRAGLSYQPRKSLTLSGNVRYISSFQVVDGANYNGTVDSYTLVDAGLSYDFSGSAKGLTVSITVQNALNKLHREYIGFPEIGRFIASRLTYLF